MEELIKSARRVEKGVPLTPELYQALFHGSSVGGVRPKALIQDQGKKYVAKFLSSINLYSVVKAEFIAMRLAELAGLNVAPVRLAKAANIDVLLIERFDRVSKGDQWSRKAMLISGDNNLSRLKTCLGTAHNFLLAEEEAREIFANLTAAIKQHWEAACEEAELNEVDKKLFGRRQFLNPYSVGQ